MAAVAQDSFSTVLDAEGRRRLAAIPIDRVHAFIADAIALCQPDTVWISTDAPADIEHTRTMAIVLREETQLRTPGHTVHFDGMQDQGRDREVTKYLVPQDDSMSHALNPIDRDEGLAEVRGLLEGSMRGRTMVVRFMTLGPAHSEFSIPCVECSDSFYISHSLNLLYRPGYEAFRHLAPDTEFFATLHASGALDERMVSAEPEKKRIYIDYSTDTVYTVNTQYAGNTLGLKKLALRLAIRKASREGWLAEHMFLMGVHGKQGRKTYLAGAFPSACGKTSTAMLPGETILGDDIAYLRAVDGHCRAANPESGIFGIITDVNERDDPAIWDVLTTPGEVLFSNVLLADGQPYWQGMRVEIPETGENYSGAWHKGKKDAKGVEIPCAHKNARYAVPLKALQNCDPALNDPKGIELSGIIYGGRDSKASVPCQQSFNWCHGIIAYGACLESETTFAVVGKEGVPEINLMSIQDFVAIPFGQYVRNNLAFGMNLDRAPIIFGVNYFLRGPDGKFLTGMRDKHVWLKWMERRIHGEAGAIEAPTGLLPRYEDLAELFGEVLGKTYTHEEYVTQFSIRVVENLAKLDRVEQYHRHNIEDAPEELFEILSAQRRRIEHAHARFGDLISPESFE